MADDAKLDARENLIASLATRIKSQGYAGETITVALGEAYDAGLAANAERLEEELIATRQSNQENFARADANAERVRELEAALRKYGFCLRCGGEKIIWGEIDGGTDDFESMTCPACEGEGLVPAVAALLSSPEPKGGGK